jgi:type II secretory pathway pseudopilin PulG
MTPRRPARSDAGATLIELIVAVAIMGVAFVTILAGIGTAIIGADIQRRDATASVVLATAAEKITAESEPYVACAASYPVPAPPEGFTVVVAEVALWDQASNRFVATLDSCLATPAADDGLQLVRLTSTSSGGSRGADVEVLEVVKRRIDP